MRVQEGMQIGVIGLGVAGISTVRHLLRAKALVRVSDMRSQEQLAKVHPELLSFLQDAGVQCEFGAHSLSFLDGLDLLVAGPGVPLKVPLIIKAKELAIPVVGELALAAGMFQVPVIAVTGSNGKTTVTGLIGHLLHTAGKKPFVGGNIGTALLDYFIEPNSYDAVVLELSSFQLDLAGEFRPDIGLWLNASPDHIDRHGSFAAYCAAKARLFAAQQEGDIAILGKDDPLVAKTALNAGVRRYEFGSSPGCEALVKQNVVCLHLTKEHEHCFSLADTKLNSSVNKQNAAAAVLAASLVGCSIEAIATGLRSFTPPPHRMAEVAVVDDVIFMNDSKATNIGALAAALAGCQQPVVLIAGGRDKGSDYTELQDVVRNKVRSLVLIGEAADLMNEALGAFVPVLRADSMEEAVLKAKKAALPGDMVLLSPGCASFDMFSGYEARGNSFAAAVVGLREKSAVSSLSKGGQ